MLHELITPSLSPLICLISVIVLSVAAVLTFNQCDIEQIKVLNEEINQLKEEANGE